MKEPNVSEPIGAVIVHYFREESLRLLLTRLAASRIAPSATVVVNNGSTCAFEQIVAENQDVQFVRLPNPGYGAAMNAGVALLPERVQAVLLLTHEVEIEDESIGVLYRQLVENDEVAAVGPTLLEGDDVDRVWSRGGALTPYRKRPFNIDRGKTTSVMSRRSSKLVRWLDGSCVLVERDAFVSAQGFDEQFWLYFEDVDFGLKLGQAGRRVRCTSEAIARQSSGGTLDQYLATRNLLLMYRKRGLRFAFALLVFESLARLAAGPVLKPRKSVGRLRKRWSGLVAGVRGN